MSAAIENQKKIDAGSSAKLDQIKSAYSKKLYHQVTEDVWAYVSKSPPPPGLPAFYEGFVKPLEGKINQLRLAQIALVTASALETAARPAFLASLASGPLTEVPARTLVGIAQAELAVGAGDLAGAGAGLETAKAATEGTFGVENVIHSAYYRALALLHEARGDHGAFYSAALLYLSYTPAADLPPGAAADWAFRVGVAGLAGPSVYNFMEILSHPVYPALEASPSHKWLTEFLTVFNTGDLAAYKKLVGTHKAALASVPVLAKASATLTTKISILALMELVFHRPAEDRTTTFAEAAAATSLGEGEVELVVMKAFSLGLFRGSIDQVARTISITWVQPRVLGREQIGSLKDRLNDWISGVSQTTRFFEAETPEFTA